MHIQFKRYNLKIVRCFHDCMPRCQLKSYFTHNFRNMSYLSSCHIFVFLAQHSLLSTVAKLQVDWKRTSIYSYCCTTLLWPPSKQILYTFAHVSVITSWRSQVSLVLLPPQKFVHLTVPFSVMKGKGVPGSNLQINSSTIFTPSLDGGMWLDSRPSGFITGVPIGQEAGWAPRSVWTLACRQSNTDRPARARRDAHWAIPALFS
jgi:hypothetical protein